MEMVLQALAAPRRREILRFLRRRERSAGEIHRALGDVTFGAVSQHLSVLEHAGLVQYAVLFDRIFRFAMTGSRVRNYDGLGGQLLFAWLHQHDVIDLTLPGVDKLFTPDDVLRVPEFLLAYQRTNSGGVTSGIPVPKFREADKTQDPARYEKQHEEYLSALKKFITGRPETMSGMELELDGVNPSRKWAELQNAHRRRVQQLAPAEAQTKYLAGKADTDLEGHASLAGVAPGNYWISTLALTAAAGGARLRWDVPVKVSAGQTLRIELTNLNATDNLSSR